MFSAAFSLVEAQFNTPTIDGVILPNECGTHTNGQNQQSLGSQQTLHLTDDANSAKAAE